MKGNPKVVALLNKTLADELTAINQYIVHSEMCNNWGYARLHEKIEKRAIQEMKHAEKTIARILFLGGKPTVTKLNEINIGEDVKRQIANDLSAELQAQRDYNRAVKECLDLGDNVTRELIESFLKDEEEHIDWLEAQQDQIAQMGIENYLANQASEK
ncbi:MAG: bacterioferritin [Planctomycetes bacterium RBG_16_59_8]|nr:MAG: bacterioferritin [Planctomycetes bacterium RBG_16_59_8]